MSSAYEKTLEITKHQLVSFGQVGSKPAAHLGEPERDDSLLAFMSLGFPVWILEVGTGSP